MRVAAVLVLLLAVGHVSSVLARQSDRVVEGSRPVAKAMAMLSRELGWTITYEDPPYVNPDDLRDLTVAPVDGKHLMVPRGGWVTLPSSAGAAPQNQPPAPRTVSREVRAACDAAYAIAAKTPGVSIRRRTGTFRDETLRVPVFGCGLAISGSFARAQATGDAAVRLRQDFAARAWQEMPAYSADGTDGTSFAFRKAGVACLVRGTWDGGAAGDPKIPAEDWYKLSVFCTSPEFPENRSP